MSHITHIGLPMPVAIDEHEIIDGLDFSAELIAQAIRSVAPYADGSTDLVLRLLQQIASEVIADMFENNRSFRSTVHQIGDPRTQERRFQAHLISMQGEIARLLANLDDTTLPLG